MIHFIRKTVANRSCYVFLASLLCSLLLNGSSLRMKFFLSQKILSAFYYPFQEAADFYSNLHDYRTENLLLKRRVTELALRLEQTNEAVRENARLRGLLSFERREFYPLSLASVIGIRNSNIAGDIIISGGRDKGYVRGLPVVTDDGVVGRIELVYAHSSLVNLLNSSGFAVSGRDERSRATGILRFDGGKMQMENVPATEDVIRGDKIITAGIGGTYPPGLPIGVVMQAFNPPGALFKQIIVNPYADINRLEEVFVMLVFEKMNPDTSITYKKFPEKDSLEYENDF